MRANAHLIFCDRAGLVWLICTNGRGIDGFVIGASSFFYKVAGTCEKLSDYGLRSDRIILWDEVYKDSYSKLYDEPFWDSISVLYAEK